MRMILIGILAIIGSLASMILLQDGTAAVVFLPLGVWSIVEGIRNGDRAFKEEMK